MPDNYPPPRLFGGNNVKVEAVLNKFEFNGTAASPLTGTNSKCVNEC
jgi:hypothetical protein